MSVEEEVIGDTTNRTMKGNSQDGVGWEMIGHISVGHLEGSMTPGEKISTREAEYD